VITLDPYRASLTIFAALLGCAPAATPSPAPWPPASVATVSTPPTPTATTSASPATLSPDADHDGVVDACDHCPREPGVDDAHHPHGRGCPHIDAFADSGAFLRGAIAIPAGGARLDQAAKARLGSIAAELKKLEHVRLFVIGHTSEDETTPGLGLARAAAVADELVRAGVDPTRIEQHDAGAAHPVRTHADAVDRKRSRRVELDLSRNHARDRAWDEARRSVEYVQPGELASCPAHLLRSR
jgi:outer membrane protein OmpA-like peptidoglycan-associated protein